MSKTYYKATNLDGTAFHCSDTLYEVGKTVRPKKSRTRELCGPGYLHAADVPTETLIGGSWPCRLFVVTGKPDAGFDERHPHKGGFKQLKVVEELPAHEVFGPQGEELVEHFERIKNCTPEQIGELASARASAGASAGASARDSAWDSLRASAWDSAWDSLRASARDSAWDSLRASAWDSAWDSAWASAWAILTRDLIGTGTYTQEQHDLLYGPWQKVMGDAKSRKELSS